MKYLIVGAGGTGGSLGAYMAAGGLDISYIARGAHLEALRSQGGLRLTDAVKGELLPPAAAFTAEEYTGQPDVILLCVKEFGIEAILPFLQKISKGAVVIPVLNIVGTGGRIAPSLPNALVLDGCIYVAAAIAGPGHITKTSKILRLVFGERAGTANQARLAAIAAEIATCGVEVEVSPNILEDGYRKYVFLSPFAAAGAYFDYSAEQLYAPGEGLELFTRLNAELIAIAAAQGIVFKDDIAAASLNMLRSMPVGGRTSMQKDLAAGGSSEMDGLVLEPGRLGRRYGIATPAYDMVAARLCPDAAK